MECLDAQAAISEALDGATSDAAALEAAKQHCRECVECAAFVRALTVVKRAPLPQPPADLTARVMAAVRREAAADRATAEHATAKAVSAVDSGAGGAVSMHGATYATDSIPTQADEPSVVPISQRLSRSRPGAVAAWIGVAALLVVGFGTVGVMGVRLISQPQATRSAVVALDSSSSRPNVGGAAPAQPPAAESAPAAVAQGGAVSSASNYIIFNGTAYRLVGPSTLSRSQVRQLGSAMTSLEGSNPRTRDVLGASDPAMVYVVDDQGQLLEFGRVVRTFQGRTYQLRSGQMTTVDTWPVLPSEIATPTSSDGAPTFVAVGADPSGAMIYRQASSTTAQGIALAPGTPANDPAGGSPNWTWWTPTP
jgi:hypothetical protein